MPSAGGLADRRGAALQAKLAALLLRDGLVTTAVAHLGLTTTEQWRATAQAAGHTIRRPVHTGLGACGTVAWAVITDWPRTTAELLRTAQFTHTKRYRSTESAPAPAAATQGACSPHPEPVRSR